MDHKKELFRYKDWWSYMFPYLFGMGYILILYFRIPPKQAYQFIAAFSLLIPTTIAFGYLLNDLTDKRDDAVAEKPNSLNSISLWETIILLICLLAVMVLSWHFLPRSLQNITIFLIQIFLLSIYSIPPLRLKKYPVTGMLIDSLYNSVIPFLILSSTALLISSHIPEKSLYGGYMAVLWAFCKGLRGILSHQVSDRINDKKAGIKSFAVKYGSAKTLSLIRYLLVSEWIFLLLLIIHLSGNGFPWLWICPVLFGFYLFFFLKRWYLLYTTENLSDKLNSTLIFNDFYEEWVPFVAIIYLVIDDLRFVLLIPVHVFLFQNTLKKTIRNLSKIPTNYLEYKQHLMNRKISAMGILPTFEPKVYLNNENKTVNALWIGSRLSIIELLTIHSFVRHGHDFHLWTYYPIENLPDSVFIRDANQIIPQKDIIVRKYTDPVTGVGKGSVGAPFSDLFRYKLLFEEGGWWVDMDVTCLRPLDFSEPYFFRNHSILDVIGNVMKCPKGSELMRRTYEETRVRCDENTLDWLLPNKILNKHIRDLDLLKYRKEGISNRDQWPETKKYLLGLQPVPPEWHIIHWSNEEFRMNKLDKDHLKFNNTTLGLLIERNGLTVDNPKFWPMVKNNIRLSRPFRLDGPALAYSDTASMLNRFYHIAKKPFLKAYWYFHGHVKYYMDKYL